MRRTGLLACLMLAMALWHGPAGAVQPGEALADPALEARARALSAELRCMVCQNQSIDLSDADLAHDLRVLVRERLTAGDSDEEVLDYVVSRYGEFVLLKPRWNVRNALLWGTPVLLLVAGAGVLFFSQRRRRKSAAQALTEEETAELDRILAGTQKSPETSL
jgi:cytochrome c-type biogenesis protein CcmH/NrfF